MNSTQFKNNVTHKTNIIHANHEIQASNLLKINKTEKNITLNEGRKILDLEEKILLKRKNDMIELLKINISNINVINNNEDFESSYNTLKMINDQLHHLKNISNQILGIKHKKGIISTNITKSEHNKINIMSFDRKNPNKSEIKTDNKFLFQDKKNLTINNSTVFQIHNTSLEKNKNRTLNDFLLNSMKENLKNNISNINSTNINVTQLGGNHVNNVSEKNKTVEKFNTTSSEINSTMNFIPSSLHDRRNSIKSDKRKSHTKIHVKPLNRSNKLKSVTHKLIPSHEIDELPSLKTKSETKIPDNKKQFPNSSAHQIDKESLYTRLVNISLSLIVIGLLMGVMLGLILVMYLKTKKDKN
jgi:hypothetical protein